jgi:hypothetical protein
MLVAERVDASGVGHHSSGGDRSPDSGRLRFRHKVLEPTQHLALAGVGLNLKEPVVRMQRADAGDKRLSVCGSLELVGGVRRRQRGTRSIRRI